MTILQYIIAIVSLILLFVFDWKLVQYTTDKKFKHLDKNKNIE